MESVDRNKACALRTSIALCAAWLFLVLGACAQMTTYVNVWHEPEATEAGEPITLDLLFQAAKIDHPRFSSIVLDENPKRVKFYNAPVVVTVRTGDTGLLDLLLPSARSWGKQKRFDDPSGLGWATIEGREMRLYFAHPPRGERTPEQ